MTSSGPALSHAPFELGINYWPRRRAMYMWRDFDLGEYDVTVVIETFEPNTEIAWSIDGVMQPPMGHVYGYRLEAIDGGTSVTSYYDWSYLHEQYAGLAERFPIISESSLRATLGILARTVAPGRGRPRA